MSTDTTPVANPNPIGETDYIIKKVGWAEVAVNAYPAGDPEDLATTLSDLIGDVLHYANANGVAIAEDLVGSAVRHFHSEGGDGEKPDDIARAWANY